MIWFEAAVSNVGCVTTDIYGRHKNNFRLYFRSSFKISKATKGIGHLRKLKPILPCRSLMIIHKSFIKALS